MTKYDKCKKCENDRFVFLGEISDGQGNYWNQFQCSKCGHINEENSND